MVKNNDDGMMEWQCDVWCVMKQWSDGVSGNGRNVGNDGGRFGRDGNEIWMGFNGKGMGWNMVHDKFIVTDLKEL